MGIKKDGKLIDSCLDNLKEGEPFFVLRGQDETAARIVSKWLDANPRLSNEKVHGVLDCINQMTEWRKAGKSKPAD